MATMRVPDRAGFNSLRGAVVAIRDDRGEGPRIVVGDRILTRLEAADLAITIEAAIAWLDVHRDTVNPSADPWSTEAPG